MFRRKPKYFYKLNIIAYILLPLSIVYYIVFLLANIRFRKAKRLAKKTICVGNVVVGGTGKTPICLEIGRFLNEKKANFCYITKGYGRSSEENVIIPKQHYKLFDYKQTGDEPLLLSNEGDVFVVDKREKTKCTGYDYAIFDDGFFDKSVKKDLKIVVFDGNFFIGNGCLLPAGPLRFSLSSLCKADFVIITNTQEDKIDKQIALLSNFISRYRILQAHLDVKSKLDKNLKYVAFAGLGSNEKFFKTAEKCGLNVVKTISFEDHIDYTKAHTDKLNKILKSVKADKFLTTSKDFVKLNDVIANKTDVLEIGYTIENIERIFEIVNNGK